MKKTESLFAYIGALAVVIVTGGVLWHTLRPGSGPARLYEYPANKFGAFLAGQHAIYVNDFDRAAEFAQSFEDTDLHIVMNTAILSEFLSGRMPEKANLLRDEKGMAARLIYDAHLLRGDDWREIYDRRKKDDSALTAPLRVWSSVAAGKSDEALKFVGKLKTNDSWKSFVRGQIFAETGQTDQAAKEFAKVSTDFMNINDYMYIVSFYTHNGMTDAADALRADFTERPGGMYMLNVNVSADWKQYSGIRNALAFGLIQNVSHTQIMMYSDLSLLLMRMAESAMDVEFGDKNALNYYIGQYFYNNGGDYKRYLASIDSASPFYSFAMMKLAEKTGDIDELTAAAKANPLFVPAVSKLIAHHVRLGEKRNALRVANRALGHANLTETGRAFFLKARAGIHLTFGDLENAQKDVRAAADVLPVDAGILAIQARIWAIEKRELETAYDYAVALVRRNPTDVEYWDVLGMVVRAREGAAAALEVIERVGQISESCSVLFEHLGDLYLELGNMKLARDAYLRAIDLSEDGLTIVPRLEKKIKNLK
jgi:tetratricopeptide (TPR) repeat protein